MTEKVYIAAPTFHMFKAYCRRHDISNHPVMFVSVTHADQLRGLRDITLYCVETGSTAQYELCRELIRHGFLYTHNGNKIKHVDM